MSDWDLIWRPHPDGPPKIDGEALSAKDVVELASQAPSPVPGDIYNIARKLAQEVLIHRWYDCENSQGSE